MTIILAPARKPGPRCKVVAPHGATTVPLDDTPCSPARRPLWPGMPRWVEREVAGEATTRGELQATAEQLAVLLEAGWRGAWPATRAEARAAITRTLDNDDGGEWWT